MRVIRANKYQGLLDIPKMAKGGKPRPRKFESSKS